MRPMRRGTSSKLDAMRMGEGNFKMLKKPNQLWQRKEVPSEPLMAAAGYYQRHKQALFRFIDDANVPIDNSATEREFQQVAKLCLNMLFAGSTHGAHRLAPFS